MAQVKENRKHARWAARARIWCEGEAVTVYAPVANISEGGLCVRTLTPFEANAPMRVRLFVGEESEMEVAARVVWQRMPVPSTPGGLGLRFEALPATAKTRLRRYLKQQVRLGHASLAN